MALSNILNEPKKEIVETVLGWGIILFWATIIIGGWLLLAFATYNISGRYWPHMKENDRGVVAFFSPVVLLLVWLLTAVAHEVGESYLGKRYKLRKRLGLCR